MLVENRMGHWDYDATLRKLEALAALPSGADSPTFRFSLAPSGLEFSCDQETEISEEGDDEGPANNGDGEAGSGGGRKKRRADRHALVCPIICICIGSIIPFPCIPLCIPYIPPPIVGAPNCCVGVVSLFLLNQPIFIPPYCVPASGCGLGEETFVCCCCGTALFMAGTPIVLF